MFLMCGGICVSLLLCVSVVYGEIRRPHILDIEEDYYFGGELRQKKEKFKLEQCHLNIPPVICNMKCFENHVCLERVCWCINEATLSITPAYKSKTSFEMTPNGFVDFTSSTASLKLLVDYTTRPNLRHHIAHFCPNLDDARDCIRACMKVGKPAFCGKDHHCYCGHKYTAPVKDQEMSAKEMYAQFKDLYAKYFGPGYSPVLDDDEDKELKSATVDYE